MFNQLKLLKLWQKEDRPKEMVALVLKDLPKLNDEESLRTIS